MAAKARPEDVYGLLSTGVDGDFYLTLYPDLVEAGMDPALHYAVTGWMEGRDPAPWFSTRAYLETHPDVAARRVNPLHHYLSRGRREGREIEASQHADRYAVLAARGATVRRAPGPAAPVRPARVPAEAPGAPAREPPRAARAEVAAAFDADYYLSVSPDVAAAGVDPLEHYLTEGWREGRDPSRSFSTRDYLELNPDVAAAGQNPFVHWVTAGRAEGRTAKLDLGFRHSVIANLRTPAERIAALPDPKLSPQPAAQLAAALSRSRSGLADLHLSVSHDDFTANVGGVQLCLQREAAGVAALGIDHLHLYPAQARPMVRAADEAGLTGVLWNGERAGVFTDAEIAAVLAEVLADVTPGRRSFAIHNLLGHAPANIVAVLKALGEARGYFWIHDFASVCAGYHLQRNDVADCGAPPVDSPACGICVYGPWRSFHIDEHARLFEAFDLTVVAPSQVALDTWRRGADHPAARAVLHPHARLEPRAGAARASRGPLRLAFLGMPAVHKGWTLFTELVEAFSEDPRYDFVHLASAPPPLSPASFHPVAVSAERPAAMREALEALSVDVTMIWALCRETFSFTAYEAAAAGCAVLTGPDSGNVAAFVAESGHGRVLPDEAALFRLFETGEVLRLARAKRKPQLYDLEFSGVTADLLTDQAAPA